MNANIEVHPLKPFSVSVATRLAGSTATSASRPGHTPVAILGVPFEHVTMTQTIERIERMIASRRPHQVVTANVDFLVQAAGDHELHRILLDAHLVLCDGTPLLWASRLLGNPLPERVAGSDLVPKLLAVAEQKQYRVFFLGGEPEVAQAAVDNIRARHPNIVIAGHYSPPFRPLADMNHDEINRRIRAAAPDLLLVSFGCPKAEKWIARHGLALGVPVCIGVGATIDFLAGKFRRAPAWMQRSGLEWLYRLSQEPRRLCSRYATNLNVFSQEMVAQWWRFQFLPRFAHGITGAVCLPGNGHWKKVQAPARLDADSVRCDGEFWEQIMAGQEDCVIDFARVQGIDSTGIGLLLHLRNRLRNAGRRLVIFSPSLCVQQALVSAQLDGIFFEVSDLDGFDRQTQSPHRRSHHENWPEHTRN